MAIAKPDNTNADWRKFPALEKLDDARHFQAVMAQVDQTCRTLDELRAQGSPTERDRANLALAAYGRMLELIDEIRSQTGAATPAAASR